MTEGYGLTESGIAQIAQNGATLMITVDCGITSVEEIAFARRNGLDVIVTDHHEPKDAIPKAFAILNPKLPACGYPDDSLAGVGVALKLGQGLVGEWAARKINGFRIWIWRPSERPRISFPCSARTASSFPRASAACRTRNPGLFALLAAQGCTGKNLSTGDVVFRSRRASMPRAGFGDPSKGVELLLTDNTASGNAYRPGTEAGQRMNEGRIDAKIQEEAFAWVGEHCDPEKDFAIIAGSAGGIAAWSASWHPKSWRNTTGLPYFFNRDDGRPAGRAGASLRCICSTRCRVRRPA